MNSFELNMLPWHLVFGAGTIAQLPDQMADLSLSRALVISTPEQAAQADHVSALLGTRAAGKFTEARMHVPIETATTARELARDLECDCSVSIGGGSTTGLGKALALDPGIPLIAIPTTYAGSEMTNIWGITDDGRKQTGRDLRVLPRLTIYDAELSRELPLSITGPSAMNAMAQATVNAYDPRVSPLVRTMALEAIGTIAQALPVVMAKSDDIVAREKLLYGASLAAAALGTGVTSLHHKLCHTLGGTFNTPHAETHTIMLPYSTAYSSAAVPELMAEIASKLGSKSAAGGIYDLAAGLGLPHSLPAIGIKEGDLDRIAGIVMEQVPDNPESVTRDKLMQLLNDALAGKRPAAE